DSVYNPIIKSEEGTGGAYAVYDMAPAYADADSFKRGFYIGDNFKTLTVRDEIELNKDNSEIYWFMHTTAEAYVTDDKTVVLSKDGETLVLNFETDADTAEVSIMDAAPLPNSPAGEGQNVNSGVRKIAIRLQASGKVSLTVRLGEFGGAVRNEPIDQWAVPEKTAEQEDAGDYGYTGYVYGLEMDGMGYVPVVSTKSFPEFKIIPHDPEKTAEIIASDSLEVPNLVRIYNSDRTRSKTYIIPYDAQRGIKDLAYEEMPIANFSVSAEPQAENRGANMFDNDFSTRWTTLNKGESAVFDLGSVQNIDGIAAGFWQSPVRNYYFDLYYSNDKVNWTKIDSYTSASGAEEYQVFSFDRINAQYLKLVGNGCSANVNTNILELRVLKRKAAFEHVAADGKSHFFEITMTA
ncbi:MAG: discoidin domain-containing protein, partial [Clostridia bacterium]|nr:discoidin domain-containing protein [Clostridia bacterium]